MMPVPPWHNKVSAVIRSCATEDQLNNAWIWSLRVLAGRINSGRLDCLEAQMMFDRFNDLISNCRAGIRRSKIRIVGESNG